jgi:hypothetical protein
LQLLLADLVLAAQWLNDQCINYYFRVLEFSTFKDEPAFLFMDPAVVSFLMLQCEGASPAAPARLPGVHLTPAPHRVADEDEVQEVTDGQQLLARRLVFTPVVGTPAVGRHRQSCEPVSQSARAAAPNDARTPVTTPPPAARRCAVVP